ncbi:MAG: tripartite tricarboxylate transporter substrate binding protein [Gammaproteobacteria bacterium]|jgi:tripartite-type tricarboxylate transporter receptor subunit TctC|nr:tripartite tricarboxylate transporter substrate binding protein [Gammaproteobacteria bacterium]MBU0788115.1 tripartite tricarboxylate transporter substrate binding protein [Gammaproteobacteria bacterium]MBU0815387.1 tripartite tricarboxylate transporter substrate binding protein [Gammaproteobacteria bacterium]MBU1785505.1 tripartite tricarboxylate transporter substrate binding protein [Gammaproteobacteria bacterium]
MKRRNFVQAGLLATTAPYAWAQGGAWPDKPVKLILSQPPGSGPDTIARLLGDRLAKSLGQAVVIENKPGGQNIIGAQAAARSPADGYTFYFATTAALVTNKYLFKTMPYDPQKDFEPVAFVAKSPFAVIVKADSPITSMQDLIARSKAAPGKVSLANEGPRTFGGIIARFINAKAKMDVNLVSYASVGVAVQDVIGGHADVVVADLASTAQLVRQGRLRYLAVTAAKRVAGWEQVPALSELLPNFEMVGWFAMVAPTGTPAAAVARMNREINTMLADADTAQRMLTVGPIAESLGGPDKLNNFLQQEHARWSEVAKEIGLLPE